MCGELGGAGQAELEAAPATAHIPVLLITALSDRADRLRGIAAGANDFVTKPVDFEDLQFRVRNSIRIKRLYDRLLEDNEKLRGVQSLRDSLTHLVVHDMRDPLQRLDAALTNLKKSRPNDGDETSAQSLNVATSATATLDVLCQSLLDLNRLQLQALRLNQTPTDLLELARRAAAVNRPLAAARNVTLESPKGALPVVCDPQVMYRVLFILIWNGLAHAPDHSTVTVQVRQDPDHCMLSVTDQGPRIPDAYLDMVFDLLRQTRLRSAGQGRSAGPGLAYCRLAVQAHAGDAGCRSDANGTHFWFTIPATRT